MSLSSRGGGGGQSPGDYPFFPKSDDTNTRLNGYLILLVSSHKNRKKFQFSHLPVLRIVWDAKNMRFARPGIICVHTSLDFKSVVKLSMIF